MLFRPEKWSSKKVKKYWHFAKGLVHGFCQKIDRFLICCFCAKKARKKHSLIFWIDNNAFGTSKVKLSQSRKKSTFSKGVSPCFLSKNRPFSDMFCLAKKGRKKHFLIFWIENKVFWTPKVKFSQSRKKRHFANGLVHGFCQKTDLFLICFFFEQTKPKRNIFWYSG